MATCRNVYLSFWTDTKVCDQFSPEDKYFMLYLLTNKYTNLCGCFKVSIGQIASDLGYSKDSVERILERFDKEYDIARFDNATSELFVRNWHKYNWTSSPKLDSALFEEIESVKNDEFHDCLADIFNERETAKIKIAYRIHTVSIPYPYGIHTVSEAENTSSLPDDYIYNASSEENVTNVSTPTNSIDVTTQETNNGKYINKQKDTDIEKIQKKKPASQSNAGLKDEPTISNTIVYLNAKINGRYVVSAESNRKFIRARLNDGYTFDDFKRVIDNQWLKWKDTDMVEYMRPETLFNATKFQSYINAPDYSKQSVPKFQNKAGRFEQIDFEKIEV